VVNKYSSKAIMTMKLMRKMVVVRPTPPTLPRKSQKPFHSKRRSSKH
jgi:hypothetical protein